MGASVWCEFWKFVISFLSHIYLYSSKFFFGIKGNFAVSRTIIELEPWKARGWVRISLNLFPTMNSVDELCFDLTCMHVVCGEGWDI